MEQIVSMGIQRNHVKCVQRFRTGQVDITFSRKDDHDPFSSKAAVVIDQCRISTRPAKESGVFITLHNAQWELGASAQNITFLTVMKQVTKQLSEHTDLGPHYSDLNNEQRLAVHCSRNWGRCPSPQRSPYRANKPVPFIFRQPLNPPPPQCKRSGTRDKKLNATKKSKTEENSLA